MRCGKDSPMELNLDPPLVSIPCVCICRNRVGPRVVTCIGDVAEYSAEVQCSLGFI